MKVFKTYAIKVAACAATAAAVISCGVAKYELPRTCNLDFEFDYTFDPPGEELLPVLAGNIEVYAFDQKTSVLTEIIRIGKSDILRGRMSARLPSGTYTFVCWATDGEQITAGGYYPAHMNDPEPEEEDYTVTQIGRTTFEEFRMMLECEELPSDVRGDIKPALTNFDDLFFSITEDIVVDGRSDVRVPFHFICDTSMLKVRIGGLDILKTRMSGYTAGSTRAGEDIPDVFVTAPHELYRHDNSLSEHSRDVRFEMPAAYVAADTMAVDIKVQRLELASYEDRPVLLHIQDPVTREDLIDPINVLEAIKAVTSDDGRHPYEDQTDIDKQYDFEIAIDVEDGGGGVLDPSRPVDLSVKVRINEYDIATPGVKI